MGHKIFDIEYPENWELKPFGKLAEFRNGVNFLKSDQGYTVNVVGVGDFQNRSVANLYNLDSVVMSRPLRNDEFLADGDLLFVRSNGNKKLIGRCMLIQNVKGPVTHSGFTIRAKVTNPDVASEYVNLQVRSYAIRKQIYTEGGGTNISNLSQDILARLKIPVPKKEEQDKIIKVSSVWDRAIDLTERLIAEKQERRKGLMQQLLTGKKRLPGFAKSTEVKEKKWMTIPADWKYPQFAEIAEHVSEKNNSSKDRPVLSCTKYKGLVDSLQYFGKKIYSDDLSPYKIVRRGQFAYATNHIEEGSIGYQDLYDEAVVSPMYTVFHVGDMVVGRYLFLLLKTELYRHIFEANTSSSVNRRGSLRWNDFSRIHVPLPVPEEQKAILAIFDTVDRELSLLELKLGALKEQKKGLMQQLLTGKIRVKV